MLTSILAFLVAGFIVAVLWCLTLIYAADRSNDPASYAMVMVITAPAIFVFAGFLGAYYWRS